MWHLLTLPWIHLYHSPMPPLASLSRRAAAGTKPRGLSGFHPPLDSFRFPPQPQCVRTLARSVAQPCDVLLSPYGLNPYGLSPYGLQPLPSFVRSFLSFFLSFVRSFVRSIARSLARSLVRSLARSFARSLALTSFLFCKNRRREQVTPQFLPSTKTYSF